ncbi:hypothetical protein HMPREF1861_01503 [Corynebacterium kroppenstedtii]|nr:hypothetical protein HMPREF1861_01503 [Corynebacterium kroppenstedtii]
MWCHGIKACCHGVEIPRGSLTAWGDTLVPILLAGTQLSTGAQLSTANAIHRYQRRT